MTSSKEIEANKALVTRFYELINEALASELEPAARKYDEMAKLFSHDARIRGGLGATGTKGHEAVMSWGWTAVGLETIRDYWEKQRIAFANYYSHIDEMLAVDDRVVTRMTYSGTHRGRWGDVDPTGARFEFVGAAFWQLSGGLVQEISVVADTHAFWRALGRV